MLQENYSDAESVVVSLIDKDGFNRCFSTKCRSGDLSFHKHCVEVFLHEAIEGGENG